MFTGITEEIGEIKKIESHSKGAVIEIECSKILSDTKVGNSILVNGVCTTVVELNFNTFKADISEETLAITTFLNLKPGDKINLERAITLNCRLGGHIVSGHVDCNAKILSVIKSDEFYNFKFKIQEGFEKYIVKKGSITINGVSLTISNVEKRIFDCAIIPHTFENTVLKYSKPNEIVNIETDILAKYIEKFLLTDETKKYISEDFLRENGFC